MGTSYLILTLHVLVTRSVSREGVTKSKAFKIKERLKELRSKTLELWFLKAESFFRWAE